jgi:hypothetical protein
MSTDLLKADDAVRLVEVAVKENRRVLGVDGFRIVPQGHIGSLDLILDVSNRPMPAEVAAAITIQFIRSNAADDVMFEVVLGDPSNGR